LNEVVFDEQGEVQKEVSVGSWVFSDVHFRHLKKCRDKKGR